jgi:hypothetical protein
MNPKETIMPDHRSIDATVSPAMGLAILKELTRTDPLMMVAQLAEAEPVVVAIAARFAQRVRARLHRHGASELIATQAADQILLAACICGEMLRRGHAKLWADLIEPEDGEERRES